MKVNCYSSGQLKLFRAAYLVSMEDFKRLFLSPNAPSGIYCPASFPGIRKLCMSVELVAKVLTLSPLETIYIIFDIIKYYLITASVNE